MFDDHRASRLMLRRHSVRGAFAASILFLGCNNKTAAPIIALEAGGPTASTAPSSSHPASTRDASVAATSTAEPQDAGVSAETYERFTNIEQIVFSFPIPTTFLKEAPEPTGVRAKKQFVSADRKSRLLLQGSFSDLALSAQYENEKAAILKRDPGAKFALSAFSEKAFVLSWTERDNIFYLKKWKTDEREFVTASFEYPPSEKARFDRIIPRVVAGMSTSP